MAEARVVFEVDRETAVATLVLNRPDRGNAIDSAMAAAMCDAIDVVENDDDVKVLVIRAEGEHLSTGWDAEDAWSMYLDAPGGSVRKHPSQRARLTAQADHWWGPRGLYSRVLKCRKVTILEAKGDCFETGLFLTLCADLVVAADDARFAVPRWRTLGPDGDLSLLIAQVGLKRAKDLMYLGRAWRADQALRYGLVERVVPRAETAAAVEEYASMGASIMRDGIVSEKYAVFASLAKMGIDFSFAATTVVSASLSNIHFQPGEPNFLRDVRRNGAESALAASREGLAEK